MKKILLFLFILQFSFIINAQDISGKWNGALEVSGTQLPLIFNVTKTPQGYTTTMDSPMQKAEGIPVTATHFENSTLKLELVDFQIEYNGTLDANQDFIGTFTQAGRSLPLKLSKKELELITPKRPQEPIKPYPYYSEEVVFENAKANVKLAGTLTLPQKEGNFPVVILISGSGPQNRDEELLGHKPFLVISDYLTRNGIAVLRYDDRGVGQSTGDFKTCTSQDFATDTEAAIQYLLTRKEINKKKIGLIGHSEGGLIAQIVAANSKNVAFIVSLAGVGVNGADLLLTQNRLIGKASGMSDEDLEKAQSINSCAYQAIQKKQDNKALEIELKGCLKKVIDNLPASQKTADFKEDEFIKEQIQELVTPWMKYFIQYRPDVYLKKIKCPVLALNGEKDLQVEPKANLAAIKKWVESNGNKKCAIKELPNLNHLFQECKTGAPSEYSTIEQTFSPIALNEISTWIQKQI
ncbi:alpha/beta hydrolase family protein [Flavobacterium sp. '19STA2R22 D10 B1']|uniref:alpha/beta hydrolase family protein n=1 Tax=Flavobacterium aerium TaxID=3037261 RepID=UPI00278C8C54|nr:alpha/beta fold hydrolase [Flavobacterium sp. '19STA2R22 D10 B1']